ncbi:MAG: DUF4132 domain-containing protein, partial [Candidatus Eremiobacterota bacterium]
TGRKPRPYVYEVPPPEGADARELENVRKGLERGPEFFHVLDHLSDRNALRLWNDTDPRKWYSSSDRLDSMLARFGLDGLPGLLAQAERDLPGTAAVLALVDSPRVAPIMARAFLRTVKARKVARTWLLTYPQAATFGLLAAAVGPQGPAREEAETAIRLAAAGHRAEVEKAAREMGAEEGLQSVLAFDPLLRVPDKLPRLPAFVDVSALPAPVLRDRSRSLPAAAVGHLCMMLCISPPDDPYAGLELVRQACDPGSLEALAWELFSAWLAAGAPARDKWAFQAVGHLGGDDSARRLAPLIREWPQQSAFARAEMGLDVLCAIGTDVALMHLHGMTQKLKSKPLQERARARLDDIAERRGLTTEELADRLVPDLGLDADGSRTLEYGPRSFRVSFTETLKPLLLDPSGKTLTDLPKPGKQDDPELATRAAEVWKALKKDARAVADLQLVRLERCLTGRRRWDAATWRSLLLEHPLLVHLVRRLVWGTYDGDRLGDSFRVAEDSSLASRHDEPFRLDPEASVGLPHPLELPEDWKRDWAQVLADYRVLQPFGQLQRQVYLPTEDERGARELKRFSGWIVPPGKLLGLLTRGWHRGEAMDGGVTGEMVKSLPGDQEATLSFQPGIFLGSPQESDPQELMTVTVAPRGGRKALPLGQLDPITFSELAAD